MGWNVIFRLKKYIKMSEMIRSVPSWLNFVLTLSSVLFSTNVRNSFTLLKK